MELKVVKPFDWAHQHVRVESFSKGQTIKTEDADLIRVSTEEGWAKIVGAKAAAAPAPAQAPEAPTDASLLPPVAGPTIDLVTSAPSVDTATTGTDQAATTAAA